MCDVRVSGKGVDVTPALREHVEKRVSEAVSVFDITPMTCEVVLRFGHGRKESDRNTCEMTLRVPRSVVRVSESGPDMYDAVDLAASKVSRQLRKYKTRLLDKHKRARREQVRTVREKPYVPSVDILASMGEPEVDDDALVREKSVVLEPMSVDEALVQLDLLGHSFYMFEEAVTGLTCVVYVRDGGGYGVLRPEFSVGQ